MSLLFAEIAYFADGGAPALGTMASSTLVTGAAAALLLAGSTSVETTSSTASPGSSWGTTAATSGTTESSWMSHLVSLALHMLLFQLALDHFVTAGIVYSFA